MEYVIIGNGVAGTTAAINIRKTDTEGNITIISDEEIPFYSRIRLIDFLAGTVDEQNLILKQPQWYDENKIGLILQDRVSEIDKDEKAVITSSEKKFNYDKVLISTGGNPFKPPIQGSDLPGVFTLRNIADAKAIYELTKDGGKAVVMIGGGVLGLETGNSLIKTGNSVTVVEFFPRLLPRQMDVAGAKILTSQLENMGFKFYLGASSKEIQGDEKVSALLLEDGRRISCDLIIISAGIRPAADLPKKIDLKMDKGVIVNDRMETEDADIYAAGDLIQHRERFYGIWPASEKQGEIAGINMAGGKAVYEGTTVSNKLKVVGIDLFCAGDIDADGEHESIINKDPENYIYNKLVIKDDIIIGTILYGDMQSWQKIMKAIESNRDISDIKEELKYWNLENL